MIRNSTSMRFTFRALGATLTACALLLAALAGSARPAAGQEPPPAPAASPAPSPSPSPEASPTPPSEPSPAPEASPAPSPEPSPTTGPNAPIVVRDHRTIRSYPANLGHNVIEVFDKSSLLPLLAGAAATGLATPFDDNVVRYFGSHPHENWGNIGRVMGTGVVAVAASTAVLGVGRFANGDRFRAATYDMSQAVVVNAFYTLVIKTAAHRERPDKSDHYSFPSGHASNAFACAQVWVEQYGWKAAIPGYLAATFVAGSRLALNKHYLSDIVAGATLGIIVGKSVVRWDAKPSHKPLPAGKTGAQVLLAPATAPDGSGLGIGVTIQF